MIFLEKIKKVARFLLNSWLPLAVAVVIVSPVFSVSADDLSLPIVMENEEWVLPIMLVDGVEVVVLAEEEATTSMASLEGKTVPSEKEIVSPDSFGCKSSPSYLSNHSNLSLAACKNTFGETGTLSFYGSLFFSNLGRNIGLLEKGCPSLQNVDSGNMYSSIAVKSVAKPGLFAFLGICPNPSELPSKSLSMQCANCLSKSTTQRFAKDSISLWQRVRTTFLWHRSINSSRIQKVSILEPFLSPTRSMSDISSIWSKETGNCLQTSPPGTMAPRKTVLSLNLLPMVPLA